MLSLSAALYTIDGNVRCPILKIIYSFIFYYEDIADLGTMNRSALLFMTIFEASNEFGVSLIDAEFQ